MIVPASSSAGAVANLTAIATDNSDLNPTVSCDPPSGSTFPIGTTTVCILSPQMDENPVGTQHTLTVTVTDHEQPVPEVAVDFAVTSGPNAGTSGQAITDANGMASFTYTGTGGVGTDPSHQSYAEPECEECVKVDDSDTGHTGSAGKTVYLHNGEFFLHAVDLEIPGRGFNWRFIRSYRSGISFNGPLGHNWEFNYNRRLFLMPGGAVLRMDGFARVDAYTFNGDGTFTAPTGFYTNLVMNPNGTFTEREPNGTKIHYSQPDARGVAVMTRLVDRNGNTMQFIYNAQNQLIRVLDTLGRSIDYFYNEQGRLSEVRDFFGRSIRFEYDQNGDLVAVTSPAVRGTLTRNNFPQGKTTRYAYSSGFSDDVLNHNLLTITAPNEVASGGEPRLRLEYDMNPTSPNRDRALRQTIGGVNQPAELVNGQIRFRRDVRVPAGGTISYEYQFLGMAPEDDFNSPVTQTAVTDRNGNRTEYQFNQLGNIVRVRELTNRDIRPGDPEFFETRYEYNKDGELIRMIYPEGNSVEYVYDDRNTDRFQQGNLLSEIRRPDSKRGGDQISIRISRTYEPIYNQVRIVTEARGNDPSYIPQNGGTASAERYTTVYIFDYQEGENFAALARELGVSESEVRQRLRDIPMGLGDVNGDGRTDQIAGNVVKVIRPTVNLLPDSHMARIEGGTRQPIEETFTYNRFGQMTSRGDAEGNVTTYSYYLENDPDGDGRDLTPGVSTEPVGYLREEIRDAVSSPERNSRTDPPPAEIHRRYFYDRVGNVIREIDGRGIVTQYAVNQLNQVVQIIRAADVSEALRNPEEPNFSGCSDQTLVECQAGMVAFRYLTNIFYDFNNNVIRREVENRDSNNRSLAGAFVEYTMAYDILDNEIEMTQEVSENPREILVTRCGYDRNENRALEISPAAVAGEQPSNVVSYVFDERDLLFTSTRGGVTNQFRSLAAHADTPERSQIQNSPDLSTFTRVYDLNRNLKQLIDGADNTGDGQPEVTTYLYDGFDRQVSVIDAIGNQSFTNYDPASNVVRASNFGPVGGPSPRSNAAATFTQPLTLQSFRQPLLSQVEFKYDELSRLFERNDRLFDYRDKGVTYVRTPELTDGPLGVPNDGIVVTRYEYDRKSRRTFLTEDDLSTFQTLYDGVDRVMAQIDPEENRVRYTYDDNNNVVKVVEIEITQRDDVAAGKVPDVRETFVTINVYDSLNRLIRTTDNIGQTTRYHYDSRDNLIFTSDAQHSQDPADLIPDPLGLFPAPEQAKRKSEVKQVAVDAGPQKNRTRINTDATDQRGLDSIRENPPNLRPFAFYDFATKTASNLASFVSPWLNSDSPVNPPSDVRSPINPKSKIENPKSAGPAFQSASRINRSGNTLEYFYDGINRKIAEARHLRVDGQGKNPVDTSNPANPDGLIVIDYDWDANSRLVAMADDGSLQGDQNTSIGIIEASNRKGNVTRYVYDDLNRRKQEIFDDGTINDYTYDADDNFVRMVDENGSIIRSTYDGINRLMHRDITRATSSTSHPVGGFKDPNVQWQVIGTTVQEFEYDGLSRLTRSFDNNEPEGTGDDAIITFAYDSLSRLLEEVQNGRAVSSRWMGDNNRIGLSYPNGRELEITFDKLDRIDRISDRGPETGDRRLIADYDYLGPGRVLERTYANGVRLTYLDDQRRNEVGYDALRRPIQLRHLRSNNSLVVGFTHTYDRMNNKLAEEKLHDPSNSELYTYDSIYRLDDFQRGTLNASQDAIVRPSANSLQRQQWTLDGVGNWQQNVLTTSGVAMTGTRQHSSLNEIVRQTTGSSAVETFYDENGNEVDDGELVLRWDYTNRLRQVRRKSDGALIAVYSYDAHGRRIRKVVTNSGALDGTTNFFYDGWRTIEERSGTHAVVQQYAYGMYIDERLVLDRNLNGDNSAIGAGDQRLFYHQNTLYSVFALTDTSSTVVEGYQYDAYGQQTVFGSGFVNVLGSQSARGNPYMLTGQRFDPETGLYYCKNRYYSPDLGRFLQRDPLEYVDGMNLYEHVRSNPINWLDPSGLQESQEDCCGLRNPLSGKTTKSAEFLRRGARDVTNRIWPKDCQKEDFDFAEGEAKKEAERACESTYDCKGKCPKKEQLCRSVVEFLGGKRGGLEKLTRTVTRTRLVRQERLIFGERLSGERYVTGMEIYWVRQEYQATEEYTACTYYVSFRCACECK
ncbi:MAG: Ig-like domain-containing protein [Acidobacteria bacterium]|nr:Ig-like domain-containing protein [Acidobacteriota bacterium]